MLRIKDWIKSYFWIPIIGVMLTGAEYRLVILTAIISFFIFSFAFVVNNYFDAELDKTHKEKIKQNKNPLANGKISKQECELFLIILCLVPIIITFFININALIFVLLSLGALSLYSSKYIRLKERKGLDIISHGLAGGLFPFFTGVAIGNGSLNAFLITISILFVILASNSLIIHQIVDYKKDLGHTKNTTIFFGLRTAHAILLFSTILGLLICLGITIKYYSQGTVMQTLLAMYFALWFTVPYYRIYKIRKQWN
jgi:4-hydroxybenzoate polyprenyltransferase